MVPSKVEVTAEAPEAPTPREKAAPVALPEVALGAPTAPVAPADPETPVAPAPPEAPVANALPTENPPVVAIAPIPEPQKTAPENGLESPTFRVLHIANVQGDLEPCG